MTTLNSGGCWLCRRTEEELSKMGVQLLQWKVATGDARTEASRTASVLICQICANVLIDKDNRN